MRRIQRGELKPGDAIMPIDSLSKRFGVARETARRAIGDLVAEGYLQAVRGRGTVVLERSEAAVASELTVRVWDAADSVFISGIRRLVDKWNRSSPDFRVSLVGGDQVVDGAEVLLLHTLSEPKEGYRLDIFQGFQDIAASVHPRFYAADIGFGSAPTFLPLAWTSRCLSIRRDLVDTNGFVPGTWSELAEWANQWHPHSELNGATYVICERAYRMGRFLPMYWSCGGSQFYEPKTGRTSVDTDALTVWFKLFRDLGDACTFLTNSSPEEPIATGRYLFNMHAGNWEPRHAQETGAELSFHLPPPWQPGGKIVTGFTFLYGAIPRHVVGEREKAMGWRFLQYLASVDVQKQLFALTDNLPVHSKLWQNDSPPGIDPVWREMIQYSRLRPSDPISQRMYAALAIEFHRFHREQTPPRQAAENFARTAETIAEIF